MKRALTILISVILTLSIVACSKNTEIKVDYPTEIEFEKALNDGEVVTDKIVSITVGDLIPNSAFGYNIQTGEHLNFCSSNNPNVKKGEKLTIKVTEVTSMLGSYIITYEKVS